MPHEHRETHANLYPSTRKARADGALLGLAGMTQVKHFRILVEAQGEGVTIAVIADIAGITRNRKGKTVNH
jgi:hypothetical protein